MKITAARILLFSLLPVLVVSKDLRGSASEKRRQLPNDKEEESSNSYKGRSKMDPGWHGGYSDAVSDGNVKAQRKKALWPEDSEKRDAVDPAVCRTDQNPGWNGPAYKPCDTTSDCVDTWKGPDEPCCLAIACICASQGGILNRRFECRE